MAVDIEKLKEEMEERPLRFNPIIKDLVRESRKIIKSKL